MTIIKDWMSWEGGVDVAGFTKPGLAMPNLIVHVGRLVHNPIGASPAGMVLWQPDPGATPILAGFVSENLESCRYFGPRIFADTPFETAPNIAAKIAVESGGGNYRARVEVAGHVFEIELSQLGVLEVVHRAPGTLPFWQQGVEAAAGKVSVKIDGKPIDLIIPEFGLSGGPAAVWSPCGSYAR